MFRVFCEIVLVRFVFLYLGFELVGMNSFVVISEVIVLVFGFFVCCVFFLEKLYLYIYFLNFVNVKEVWGIWGLLLRFFICVV